MHGRNLLRCAPQRVTDRTPGLPSLPRHRMRERCLSRTAAPGQGRQDPNYSLSVNTTERYDTGPEWIASIPCSAVASNSSVSPAFTSTAFAP